MTKLPILGALVLALSAGPCLSGATQGNVRVVSETAVRDASARLYSDILSRACRKGWRYPRPQIENGFKRHFGELKLQLIDQGYTIVPDIIANDPPVQRMIDGAKRQPVGSRQYGCSRPYWLDE